MIGQDNPFGCAPKTNRTAGEGPGGSVCPPTPKPPNGVSFYWPNPCDDYDFQNSSRHGLGCDRTSSGVGSKMTDTYSPGVSAMLDDPATIPPELLLFFHNVGWTDLVPAYGRAGNVPLYQWIKDRHAGALRDVRGFVEKWNALEGAMAGDEARWAGVKARFAQQLNDAEVFSEKI